MTEHTHLFVYRWSVRSLYRIVKVPLKKVNRFNDIWKKLTISPIDIVCVRINPDDWLITLKKNLIWKWFILSSKSFWLNTNRYNYTPVTYGINWTPVIYFLLHHSIWLIIYLLNTTKFNRWRRGCIISGQHVLTLKYLDRMRGTCTIVWLLSDVSIAKKWQVHRTSHETRQRYMYSIMWQDSSIFWLFKIYCTFLLFWWI
jgi:hypothetical protein